MPIENPSPPVAQPAVLSFAASDPTCGAGSQADLLSIAALGGQPLTVITALTVQDTAGVEGILALDADWVLEQARVLLEDIPVAAFKLGMLGTVETVTGIAEILADYPQVPVVFDPVLASGRGDELADEDLIAAMVELLLPQTTVVTPNSIEARRLAAELSPNGMDRPPLERCAQLLVGTGCEAVLITGTHEPTSGVTNTLYGSHGAIRSDTWDRLPGSYHGSGCTLAAALATLLARGLDLAEAARAAQAFTWQSLATGTRPGMGQFLPNRLHALKTAI